MYVARTQEEILKELQSWSKSAESKVEGSFSYDVFSTNAIEFQKLELELEESYRAAFGDTATNEYLEMRAAEHGVIRREATKAVGELDVTGTGLIKAGAIFQTAKDTKFIAVTDTEIVSSGTVKVEAVNAGASGNVAANTINKIPLNIVGIQSVNNPEPTVDGYDEETDEELRERYLMKVRFPATSGNAAHYVQWSLEISGVGAASCIRCWNGRGSVLVLIVDTDFNPANDELIERVAEHIETRRPIGVEVTVQAAEPITVNISANVLGTLDLDAFKAGVTKYFRQLMLGRFVNYTSVESYSQIMEIPAGAVTRAMIGSIIEVEGGADYNYDSLKLNGNAADIALTVSQIPQLGTCTFNVTQTITG